MKLRIITADPEALKWPSLDAKLTEIANALNKTKNATWEVSIEHQNIKPTIKDGRITQEWFNDFAYPHFRNGYQFVYLHFSMKQWQDLGLDQNIRGANQKDDDFVGESYGRGDENTKRGRTRQNQFIQNVLHEMSHELHRTTGVIDRTHEYHDKNSDISGIFASIDMSKWQPVYQESMNKIGLLTRVIELTKQLNILKKKNRKPEALLPLVQRQADLIIKEMEQRGHPVRLNEGFRSIERQNQLYAQGRTTPGNIVTNAKGGESFHNYGVAVDFVFRKEGYDASEKLWQTLGKVGKKYGFEWGGDWSGFVDRPHFEMKLGYSLKDFQQDKVDYSRFR